MLYCCGGRETKREPEHAGAEEALMSTGDTETGTTAIQEETPARGMLDTADMPELLPPSLPQLQPETRDSVTEMQLRDEVRRDCLSPESPQQRLGQRAPKLGQIGRSKRVVIEDEDLNDIVNNNNNNLVSEPLCSEPP